MLDALGSLYVHLDSQKSAVGDREGQLDPTCAAQLDFMRAASRHDAGRRTRVSNRTHATLLNLATIFIPTYHFDAR